MCLEEQEIFLDGQAYLWQYRPDGPAEDCWNWSTAKTYDDVPEEIDVRLRQYFFKKVAPLMVQGIKDFERERLQRILLSMGFNEHEIIQAVGLRPPSVIKCRDCRKMANDHYPDGRCKKCYEKFIRRGRIRNSSGNWFNGGRMK
jgi:hypothetical protein